MKVSRNSCALASAATLLAATISLSAGTARADAITDWNSHVLKATKGYNGTTGAGVALGTNLATRILAITGRAVFDAVNSINHFSEDYYYYDGSNSGSAQAAAVQAAYDVVVSQLPDAPAWEPTRAWLEAQRAADLAALRVNAADPGIQAGREAAAAAIQARQFDNSAPVTNYGPTLTPTSNPGIGLWRQSNAAGVVNPETGAPTGFDAGGTIDGRPGVDFNWRDVTPFSLTNPQRANLVALVPVPLEVDSKEYDLELEYVRAHGQDTSRARDADQTAQALYYKLDAELFVNEAARIASAARKLTLNQNARLFALLGSVVADARIASYASKYEQKVWRPITALNADADGAVTNEYADWRPLAATPSHPSNTAGHSTTGASGFRVLRAFFGDKIRPDGQPVTLGTLPWLTGTNNGTGNATSRSVRTFSQAQLENGASRLYLGVHYGFDNLQGQLLGLAVADTIIDSDDPAAAGLSTNDSSPASLKKIRRTLLSAPKLYGYYGREPRRNQTELDDVDLRQYRPHKPRRHHHRW
ncbi:vanadium-dependent haloperoxidase [Nitrosovibrio sp. Nv17]|uniref:vanadium-dependent haloperoxidase n=1 Tax=Nitrosovibrio sp. Nv17 TaxID=1855339 RepID=UPI0009087F43|nr:vanadium-dependent haloperoxidase [Nitrosovibrio sp. Nv17]SFW37364.1 PAP2 superfamily protein [Nitrosovibrio sp. Nv17]